MRHTYHRIHRCPDVVGHRGKELALGTIGALCCLPRLLLSAEAAFHKIGIEQGDCC